MTGARVLQEGHGRLVVLEDDGTAVRKTFHDGPLEVRRDLARDEFERLQRFGAALEAVPGAACPRPLELLDDPPGLRMARAAGSPLYEQLGTGRFDATALERFAHVLAAAIRAYGSALGEPLPDLNLENVLHDERSGILTLLDLGRPQDHVEPDRDASPDEVTLGDLLGSTVFESVRPRHAAARRRHAEAAALCAAIVRETAALDGAVVRPEQLDRAARTTYRRCAFGRGAATTAWYAAAGPLLARRIRTAHGTFGPAGLRG